MTTTARERLREAGLQVTAQRIALLEALDGRPHATVDDLTTAVRERIGSVSRQAIYDALAAMELKTLVRRIEPAHSPARWEVRVRDNHHHLVCRGCGQVQDVDCAVGHAPCLEPAQAHGFAVDEAEVIYWGWCAQCRETGHHAP